MRNIHLIHVNKAKASLKARQLRVGNWVNSPSHQLQVDAKFIYEFEQVGGNYEPIPLTEEWLVRFGAINGSISMCFVGLKIGSSVLNVNPDNGVVWITNGGEIFNVPKLILYVHEFQNLIHSLTGEELTLTENDSEVNINLVEKPITILHNPNVSKETMAKAKQAVQSIIEKKRLNKS